MFLQCLCILSCCVKLTRVLVKGQFESRQRQVGVTAVVKVRTYVVSIDRKRTVYRLETCKIVFGEMCTKLSIATIPIFHACEFKLISSI